MYDVTVIQQHTTVQADTINKCAIGAFQILKQQVILNNFQVSMVPRDSTIIDAQIVIRPTADRNLSGRNVCSMSIPTVIRSAQQQQQRLDAIAFRRGILA